MRRLRSIFIVCVVSMSTLSVPTASQAEEDEDEGYVGKEYPSEWEISDEVCERNQEDPDDDDEDPDDDAPREELCIEEAAADDGYEIVQLTTDEAMDTKMYLRTTTYVPSLDSIVFMSERVDRAQNLFLMSLEDDGTFVQLTDSEDPEPKDPDDCKDDDEKDKKDKKDEDCDNEREIDADHANVSPVPGAEAVYFRQNAKDWEDGNGQQVIKRVSLRSAEDYEETIIYQQENGWWDLKGTPSLSSDGKTLVTFEHCSDKKECKKDYDHSRIVTIDLTGDEHEKTTVAQVEGKGDHLWINPVHGDTVLYHVLIGDKEPCKKGDDCDAEVGLVDIDSGVVTVLSDEDELGHGVHPFWRPAEDPARPDDGYIAGYMYKHDDECGKKGHPRKCHEDEEPEEPNKVVTYDIRNLEDDGDFDEDDLVEHALPDDEYSSHMAMSSTGDLLQGDGGTSSGEDYHYFYENLEPEGGEMDPGVKMFEHGSCKDHGEQVHPHADFINRSDLLFNSDEFFIHHPEEDGDDCEKNVDDEDDGNVFLLRKKVPEPVFEEDFENIDGDWVRLPDYVGAAGTTYTGSDYWTSVAACNGMVLRQASPPEPRSGCASYDVDDDAVENAAVYAPMATGGEPSTTNHAWTFWSAGPMAPGQVMLKTSDIDVTPGERYLQLEFDGVGMSCTHAHPALVFSLLDDGVERPAFGATIDPCEGTQVADTQWGPVRVGHYVSDVAVPVTGSRVNIVLRNESDRDVGNDGGIDNLRLVDVTPSVSVEFDPADPVPVETPTRLQFVVTNTPDGLAKDGWDFESRLPENLKVVEGEVTSTCGGEVTASRRSIAFTGGSLESGRSSCSVSVPVISERSGTYKVSDISTTALDVAGSATVEYHE